jgi:hypothetical protein
MRREIIDDDVDLPPFGLVSHDVSQEGDELGRGVAIGRFAQHFPGLRVQGCTQRQRAMPVILKAMPFGTAGRQGQYRIQPVQRLDRRLSSTQNTAACTGGFKYSPRMSAAFDSNSGSSEAM